MELLLFSIEREKMKTVRDFLNKDEVDSLSKVHVIDELKQHFQKIYFPKSNRSLESQSKSRRRSRNRSRKFRLRGGVWYLYVLTSYLYDKNIKFCDLAKF